VAREQGVGGSFAGIFGFTPAHGDLATAVFRDEFAGHGDRAKKIGVGIGLGLHQVELGLRRHGVRILDIEGFLDVPSSAADFATLEGGRVTVLETDWDWVGIVIFCRCLKPRHNSRGGHAPCGQTYSHLRRRCE
jgi:hypothetical protein